MCVSWAAVALFLFFFAFVVALFVHFYAVQNLIFLVLLLLLPIDSILPSLICSNSIGFQDSLSYLLWNELPAIPSTLGSAGSVKTKHVDITRPMDQASSFPGQDANAVRLPAGSSAGFRGDVN